MNRKWTTVEDNLLLELKASDNTWKQISEFLGTPKSTCIYRYSKLIQKAVKWDKEMDENLEKAYRKRREEIWKGIAGDIQVPWRAAEARMWDLGMKKFVKR